MYKRVSKLISQQQAKSLFPAHLAEQKKDFDNEIKNIIGGNGKLLLIIGPCSADNPSAVLAYCERLKVIAEKVKDKIFIVPRIYTTKPRSESGKYRGMLHSHDTIGQDFNKGILVARKLMIDVANNFGFFAADEMLYPELYHYFDDVLSYVTIGARSSEDQIHRLAASCLDVPVGIKNPMHGNLKSVAQAIKIANSSNNFVLGGYEVQSYGNPFAHAILRGYVDNDGRMHENYSEAYIDKLCCECNELDVKPAVIIDCNHFNSGKNYLRESDIALKVIGYNRKEIKGLMLESYILDGRQDTLIEFGKSLTDECIGMEKTERLIFNIANKI